MGERYLGLRAALDFGDLPKLPVKAIWPAMKRMSAVIGSKPHHLSVEREAGIGDAIGIAADGRAEEPALGEVTG